MSHRCWSASVTTSSTAIKPEQQCRPTLCSYLWHWTAGCNKGKLFPAIRGQAGTGYRHISLIIVGKLTSSNNRDTKNDHKDDKTTQRRHTATTEMCKMTEKRHRRTTKMQKWPHRNKRETHNDHKETQWHMAWGEGESQACSIHSWRRLNGINSSIYRYYTIIEYLKLHSCHLFIK